MLYDNEYYEQADSRAYYAAFYAAEAALLALGEARSKHSGLMAAFGRLVVKEGGFDAELWRSYRDLFELRNVADYEWLDSPPSAADPLQVATPFVDAVEAWIAERQSAG